MTHLESGLHCTQCAAANDCRTLPTRIIATLRRQQHTDAHRASLDRREGRSGRAARHRCAQSIRQLACEPRGTSCISQMLTGIRQHAFEPALHRRHCTGAHRQLALCLWPSRQPHRREESALVQAGFSTCACAFASDLAAPERHLFRRCLSHACVHISAQCHGHRKFEQPEERSFRRFAFAHAVCAGHRCKLASHALHLRLCKT